MPARDNEIGCASEAEKPGKADNRGQDGGQAQEVLPSGQLVGQAALGVVRVQHGNHSKTKMSEPARGSLARPAATSC
jgi:hypothetical protein